ncbi:MAG: Mut7-C RNAse domain-containing protein [Bacteroidales bacterium]|nr:Mut7-C RNAse domain-containing protein [Bacteroidales bacterium]
MKRISIRFYAELNDFLAKHLRQCRVEHEFILKDTVRNASGILRSAAYRKQNLVLVNGRTAAFDDELQDGDDMSVFPVFESFDISTLTRLRAEPLREPAFIADVHLGKLTGYLRMLGFNCLYHNTLKDEEIIRISAAEQRIILTRDKGILKNKNVTRGFFVRSGNPKKQLEEVLRRFDLKALIKPFTRCMRCNGLLQWVSKKDITEILEENTKKNCDEFYRCSSCGKIYWKGTHYQSMKKWVQELLGAGRE